METLASVEEEEGGKARKEMDAFTLLMRKEKCYTEKKTSSSGTKYVNAKDQIYNELVDMQTTMETYFTAKSEAISTGAYITQIITNALWYVTNDHATIKDASRVKSVVPVPEVFENFKDRDDFKTKRFKKRRMTVSDLDSHAQALYSILMKPIMKSTDAWAKLHAEVKSLADCIESYKQFLDEKNREIQRNQSLEHPVRPVAENATAEYRAPARRIDDKYAILNDAIKESGTVFVDEDLHLGKNFTNNMQRLRFYEELQLSVPVDLYKYSPGGSIVTSVCVVQVEKDRTTDEMLTQSARFMASDDAKRHFKEYHTRYQRKLFRDRLGNIASVQPGLADVIYRELALDASVAAHPTTAERMRLVFLGDHNLIADLRHLSPGRPGNAFDEFFTEMEKLVEETTAADDRRHNIAHLARWISIEDLMKETEKQCRSGVAIPSKSLVRLQFAPKNPYTRTVLNFTSRIKVQYKIQRRQLRQTHVDQHYTGAQFKYIRERAVELGKDGAILLFADDKSKVPIGNPGLRVSTGVRGKKTLTPVTTELAALDHDMTKCSLTPSVSLVAEIPSTSSKSFVQGRVITTINDAVFESSSPFRHAATWLKILENYEQKVLLIFTDGGTDHRNNLESVMLSLICLFKALDLDMLCAGRCAPGQSFTNPAERVMSVLNLGLQNCSLEREKMDEMSEFIVKGCGSMKEIQKETKLKEAWGAAMAPVKACIKERFERLKLKDQPIEVLDSISQKDIQTLQNITKALFPTIEPGSITKVAAKKDAKFVAWKADHCRERRYIFQIRKCDDRSCCNPAHSEENRLWVPDPVHDSSGEHYKPYAEVKGLDTEDKRPSLKPAKPEKKATKKRKRVHLEVENPGQPDIAEASEEPVSKDNIPLTVQNARYIINCTECNKPRILYSRHKLTERQQVVIAQILSSYDFTCGAEFCPYDHPLQKQIVSRPRIGCADPLEIPYYASGLGDASSCVQCGELGGEVKKSLREQYKTVTPICSTCTNAGLIPVVARPYGHGKK